MERMFKTQEEGRTRMFTVEAIPEVMDGWERLSEMPDIVAYQMALRTGLFGCEHPEWAWDPERCRAAQERQQTQSPRPAWRLSDGEPPAPTGAEWRVQVDEKLLDDPHRTLRWALVSWLTSEFAVCDEKALELPPLALVLRRLPDLWRRFDEVPPIVAFHFAFALLSGLDEAAMRTAATRLAGELWPEDDLGYGTEAFRQRMLVWVRGVATKSPVLAMKVGAEAMMRSSFARDRSNKVAGA